MTDERDAIKKDLAQLVRLALTEQPEDVRLFTARLVRKYRGTDPALAEQFDYLLKVKSSRSNSSLRKSEKTATGNPIEFPIDEETRLSLLKINNNCEQASPLLSEEIKSALQQLIKERTYFEQLKSQGLLPTRSAIFVGKPGVGKTLTARWLADQLGLPLFILDLTTVMSSLLGKTGANLRAAIDFAKQKPCILLLDEIDSIAKRRNDDTDIGELKRLVTVMLQEVEYWPSTGLLLAATNHPELIDPALWRRFDLIVNFGMPETPAIKEAIQYFFGPDFFKFQRWVNILAFSFNGESFSDIERTINHFRRSLVLDMATELELVEAFVSSKAKSLEKQNRIDLSLLLAKETKLSQHRISEITGVSRDTIRKYTGAKTEIKGGTKNE